MMQRAKRIIVGASLGNCVHVGGVLRFLKLAERYHFETVYLGPAISLGRLQERITELNPDIVALSYRLTPEVLSNLLQSLKAIITEKKWGKKSFIFGGTPPAAEIARQSGIFSEVFDGTESANDIIAFLQGKARPVKQEGIPPQNLIDRIAFKAPYPLFRHHFGRPSLNETIAGARELALSKRIDVLSLGPDQNAQENFFRPVEMSQEHGAGGVPLRTPEDLRAIYQATRCGNYPLLRCYSGTRDLIRWAEMSLKMINIAWGAVPLFWYNQLDGRSNRILSDAIAENQGAMRWYGEHGLPLEVNEAHHWSLRDAPDSVAVAAAFLGAYNAKKTGVSNYVAQYMFNTPPQTSAAMDLAKMLAKIALIESLHDESFRTIRQVRTGLAYLDPEPSVAMGQLASSTFYQLALEPEIVHVVGFCEGDHAAKPSDIIESVKIIEGVIDNHLMGPLSLANDAAIEARKAELLDSARQLLDAIAKIAPEGVEDPWTDPATLAGSVRIGLLDAPHLCGNSQAAGAVFTQMKGGACVPVDLETGGEVSEKERIERIMRKHPR